jgi:hypothetical protein
LQVRASKVYTNPLIRSSGRKLHPRPTAEGANSISTSLGTQNRYLVKVPSCGYSGTVTLTPKGAPASWTLTMDPPSKSLAPNAVAVAQLTDGDSGLHSIAVDAAVRVPTPQR